jgi:Fe2+ transport system protein FeoA
MLLSELPLGKKAKIKQLTCTDLRLKMIEMGLYEGVEVVKELETLAKGPMAFWVNDYLLSLRYSEAKMVEIELID